MALITVIVPNYNHARFLKRRMESIINQTFQDFEVIILDDASTDGSSEIIESYRNNPRVKCIHYNSKNTGRPMAQWLNGISLAQSDWIWIAESDDYCELNFLENLMPGLLSDKCSVAFNEVCFVAENGQPIHPPKRYNACWWNGDDFLISKLISTPTLCNSSMALFRKSSLQFDFKLLDKYSYSPDYLFWCELVKGNKVYGSGQPVSYFVKHAQEFTHGKVGALHDIQDHTRLIDYLLLKQYISKSEAKNVIKKKLVYYACIKKGMSLELHRLLTAAWLGLAWKWEIKLKQFQIDFEAFCRKWKHKKSNLFKNRSLA